MIVSLDASTTTFIHSNLQCDKLGESMQRERLNNNYVQPAQKDHNNNAFKNTHMSESSGIALIHKDIGIMFQNSLDRSMLMNRVGHWNSIYDLTGGP